jgi:Formyl transferase
MELSEREEYKIKKLALFIGSDVSANLIAFELIALLHREGIYTVLIYPIHAASKKKLPDEITDLRFYERALLNETIFPYLEEKGDPSRLTPQNICRKYQSILLEGADINKPEFLLQLEELGVSCGLSIRCYQKFGEGIVNYFKKGFLWNLHPGILPAYRGVMTLYRSMDHGDKQFGYTLHEIDLNWDAGAIIHIAKENINYAQCFLTNMLNLYPVGTMTAFPRLLEFFHREKVPSVTQNSKEANYYSFPTEEELGEFRKKNLKLVDHQSLINKLADKFSCNLCMRDELLALLKQQNDLYLRGKEPISV